MERRILLVAFKFPPMGGIGTRRWVKFLKYFARAGVGATVVTLDYPYEDEISWVKELAAIDRLSVVRMPSNYPSYVFKPEKNLLQRIHAKLVNAVVTQARGEIDLAEGWAARSVPEIKRQLARSGASTVILSGPPSSVHFIGVILKSDLPDVQIIQDYRDPWNSVREYATEIMEGRKVRSVEHEYLAVHMADDIVVVTNDMKRNLARQFHLDERRIHVIPNGYDPEDYPPDLPKAAATGDPVRIVYGGTVGKDGNNRLRAVRLLAEVLNEQSRHEGKRPVEVVFFSDIGPRDVGMSEQHPPAWIQFNRLIEPPDYLKRIVDFDVSLSINAASDPHAFGTKIFDAMALRKRIFLISPEGELSRLLEERGQYVAEYDAVSIANAIERIRNEADGKSEARYDEYNVEVLAGRYLELVK